LIGDVCVKSESLNLLIHLKRLVVWMFSFRNLGIRRLRFVTLPYLEELIIIYPFEQPLELYVRLIKGTKGELRKLDIDSSHRPSLTTQQYIETVSRFCPKLEFVKTWYDDEGELENLEKILISCKLLKSLTIESLYRYGQMGRCHAKCVFNLLIEKSGSRFSNLYLNGLWEFSIKDLEEFFGGWERKGKIPLFIEFDSKDVVLDEHHVVFQKYKDLGVLSDYQVKDR